MNPLSNKKILSLNGQPIKINNSYISIETEGLQNKTITPKAYQQVIFADSTYNGLNSVTIEGDNNLIPENIKAGVTIFGIVGTYTGN